MKKTVLSATLLALAFILQAQAVKKSENQFSPGVTINPNFSKAAKLDSILKSYAPAVLPGVALAVYTEAEGWWAGTAGYANVETKKRMQLNHLQYLQSVSKMYMGVAVLQLAERGKIKLDAPVTDYLPLKYSTYITDAAKITVRMLLNHTSGIPEYNGRPRFVSQVILNPRKNFRSEDCLEAIKHLPLNFVPGSKYAYTNTNYLVLTLIVDAITGDHAAFIRQNIFAKLHLQNSYYDKGNTYLNGLNLPESYWDVLNNEMPANITPLQKVTVANSKGDDGIVCSVTDAVLFLKGLMEGKLLSETSMKEMLHFVKDENGNDKYGMGIFYFDLGGIPAYGHGGGGVGAGCGLLYIPSHKTYLFIAANIGVLIEGKLPAKADQMKTEILMTLLL
ncbi:MAG: beta-lactamase family protein [Sphingobacteriales bacterium]|nr:beta-lactamase family protein [Sphingobacteriales bacterium]